MSHWHFRFRPPRKQNLEESSTDLAVQFTDTVDSAAAPDCQISHIERLGRILAISPTKCEKFLERDRQVFFCILPQVTLNQAGSEAVKPRFYGSVRCKKVAGATDGERDIERLIIVFHVATGSFQHCERSVTFIKMANFGVDSECAQEAPASNTKDQLLFHP
jgi:hypothetical protein